VTLGILLALGCALATQLGFLYKHRGANEAPSVDFRRPLLSGASLFRSKWFAVGMAIALGAWLLHVAALVFAPLSVVQAVLSTGVVMLAVLAERIFGFKVGPRQWAGVAMTAAGLILLVVTLPAAHGTHSAERGRGDSAGSRPSPAGTVRDRRERGCRQRGGNEA